MLLSFILYSAGLTLSSHSPTQHSANRLCALTDERTLLTLLRTAPLIVYPSMDCWEAFAERVESRRWELIREVTRDPEIGNLRDLIACKSRNIRAYERLAKLLVKLFCHGEGMAEWAEGLDKDPWDVA